MWVFTDKKWYSKFTHLTHKIAHKTVLHTWSVLIDKKLARAKLYLLGILGLWGLCRVLRFIGLISFMADSSSRNLRELGLFGSSYFMRVAHTIHFVLTLKINKQTNKQTIRSTCHTVLIPLPVLKDPTFVKVVKFTTLSFHPYYRIFGTLSILSSGHCYLHIHRRDY